jgi:hypothetical protein
MRQITDHIIMIRPKHFGYNTETASNNTFQSDDHSLAPEKISELALKEFDAFVELLEKNGIHVDVIEDTDNPVKPDAIFPNNWFSTHGDGAIITYPMRSAVRRLERREDVVDQLSRQYGGAKRYSFEVFEDQNQFLEGTGSMVLDREHRIAYACISPRTDVELLDKFCVLRGYTPRAFHAFYEDAAVYHTNVVMALATTYVVICMECIPDEKEREMLRSSFRQANKEIIEISTAQMAAFAGNMIQLQSRFGDAICVMSEQAHRSLSKEQLAAIEKHNRILSAPVYTIEKYGGGSARCMIAENFLAK